MSPHGRSMDWVSVQIDSKLYGLTPPPTERCIFKVHHQLRSVNEKAYEPAMLAVGPYHRGKKSLQVTEEHKLRYLKGLLDRRKESSVETYVMELRSMEEKARNCYGEPISLSVDQFVEMMLLDGCFIIELFRQHAKPEPTDVCDPIFNMDWILGCLARDIMLFENQLPFFVLRQLFDMTLDPEPPNNDLIKIALDFFAQQLPNLGSLKEPRENSTSEIQHLLGLVHNHMLSPFAPTTNQRNAGVLQSIYNCILSSFAPTRNMTDAAVPQSTSAVTQSASAEPQSASAVRQSTSDVCCASALWQSASALRQSAPVVSQTTSAVCFASAVSQSAPVVSQSTSAVCFASAVSQSASAEPESPSAEQQSAFPVCVASAKRQSTSAVSQSASAEPESPSAEPQSAFAICLAPAKRQSTSAALPSIPCATALVEAGVKFRRVDNRNPFDVRFKNGVLEIPPLSIEDQTESLFRNLIAYEQYCQDSNVNYVTNYVTFMDYLINSFKDVELLCHHKIIENWMGDHEVVATMFNRLRDNVTTDNNCYAEIFKYVNNYCRRCWNVSMAKLRRDYFNSPWAFISFLAAVLLLVLTLTQTVFSILSYVFQ